MMFFLNVFRMNWKNNIRASVSELSKKEPKTTALFTLKGRQNTKGAVVNVLS